MPQLAGQSCVICQERIDGDFEAGYCPACHYPRHDQCAKPPVTPDGQSCPTCGANVAACAQFVGEREIPIVVDTTRPCNCPVCGLANPPGTARCECGYSFRHEATEGRDTVTRVAVRNLFAGAGLLFAGVACFLIALLVFGSKAFCIFFLLVTISGAGLLGRGAMQFGRSRRLPVPGSQSS
jgi:hypothetical protein